MRDVYKENGYENREDYLKALASDYDVRLSVVISLADVLGPEEDFDGLINELEDYVGLEL